MRAQDSIVIIWLSTENLTNDAVGIMVREQCPARFPFTHLLVCNVTLPLLSFCAGLSTETWVVSRVGLHLRRISSSFDAQGSLGAFPPHILTLFRPETHLHHHRWLERAALAGDRKQFLDTYLK